jgi:hypothetical protein
VRVGADDVAEVVRDEDELFVFNVVVERVGERPVDEFSYGEGALDVGVCVVHAPNEVVVQLLSSVNRKVIEVAKRDALARKAKSDGVDGRLARMLNAVEALFLYRRTVSTNSSRLPPALA